MQKIKIAKLFIKNIVKANHDYFEEVTSEDFIHHNNDEINTKYQFLEIIDLLESSPILRKIIVETEKELCNYVFLKCVYIFVGNVKQVSYDIFRFESNKIKEHWTIFD
ncbi:MAG TPA: hypothetical protein HA255_02165 [Methanosphaera sp.]|nr:hypothetical protein [Methanosphaera sp.]